MAYFPRTSDSPRQDVAVQTIVCPDLTKALEAVPSSAQRPVDEKSALLDLQIATAFSKLRGEESGSPAEVSAILSDLANQRRETLAQMEAEINRAAGTSPPLKSMAACTTRMDTDPRTLLAQRENGQGRLPADSGLSARDFVDITKAPTTANRPGKAGDAGSFVVDCGRNQNTHLNSDNVIVAPGVRNGAHHMHDYVGNVSTDASSGNRSLAAAGTTCRNGDRSTHYWPVLRLLDGSQERDAADLGGGKDNNKGQILTPATVTLTFDKGDARSVSGMPPFLSLITGDAKALTNGTANARAAWTCTGFEGRSLDAKYPLCPPGAQVVRTLEFPSCWDGRNAISANHRSHVAFPAADGSCKKGFKAIPRLTQRITYDIPQGALYAVDTFPEQLHKAVTDHGDFINVMSTNQMDQVVQCINSGKVCKQ